MPRSVSIAQQCSPPNAALQVYRHHIAHRSAMRICSSLASGQSATRPRFGKYIAVAVCNGIGRHVTQRQQQYGILRTLLSFFTRGHMRLRSLFSLRLTMHTYNEPPSCFLLGCQGAAHRRAPCKYPQNGGCKQTLQLC